MRFPWRLLLCAASLAGSATPTLGQSRAQGATVPAEEDEQQQQEQQPLQQQQRPVADTSGRVAESAVGRAGQRQTREDVAPNLRPMGRISNRIENRIESRIRNRIDPDEDPQIKAKSAFEAAEERERTAGR